MKRLMSTFSVQQSNQNPVWLGYIRDNTIELFRGWFQGVYANLLVLREDCQSFGPISEGWWPGVLDLHSLRRFTTRLARRGLWVGGVVSGEVGTLLETNSKFAPKNRPYNWVETINYSL